MNRDSFVYYAAQSLERVVRELKTSASLGLAESEVVRRRGIYGPNELVSKKDSWVYLFVRQLHSPIVYLLCSAAVLLALLQSFTEATLLLVIVGLNTALGFYQEFRSARILAHLRSLLRTRCSVLRNGQRISCASQELVPGDIIFFAAGDRIVADVRIIKAQDLFLDESILTGESAAVQKTSDVPEPVTSSFQARTICFAGTLVVSGSGVGVVIATGEQSYFGAISTLTAETVRLSSFSKDIGRFSAFLIRLMFVSIIILFIVRMVLFPPLHINWIDFFVFSVALAVTIIPEALPVVITFCLSQGALLLAHKKVIVKRLSAIEDLGDMEVLCTDKTGTITENSMSVAQVYGQNVIWVRVCALLAASNTHSSDERKGFDAAIYTALDESEKEQASGYVRLAEIPFVAEKRFNAVLLSHVQEGKTVQVICMRGAIEPILERCQLHAAQGRAEFLAWAIREGEQGRRVIALATRELVADEVFSQVVAQDQKFTFVGALSFEDPIKPTVISSLTRANELGIVVKMLSGDSPEVCAAVANQVGLVLDAHQYMTGEQFSRLTVAEQECAVQQYAVFSRVSPQEKYAIVQLLQKTYVVGYLGDGINDAPALKVAHVGLAVDDGAEIAKDAADIILLKKSLHVIVDGVEEGRKVFSNTLKYIRSSLSSTFGNFYSLGIVSLFIPFLPMLPVQLVLVNFLSDFPMIAIATDSVDKNELKRPGKYDIRRILFLIVIFGLVSSLFDFIFFSIFYHFSAAVLQTGWFVESILTELVFFYSIRTPRFFLFAHRPSRILLTISALAMFITLWLPVSFIGQTFLGFAHLTLQHYLIIITIVLAYLGTSELVKFFYYRNVKNN